MVPPRPVQLRLDGSCKRERAVPLFPKQPIPDPRILQKGLLHGIITIVVVVVRSEIVEVFVGCDEAEAGERPCFQPCRRLPIRTRVRIQVRMLRVVRKQQPLLATTIAIEIDRQLLKLIRNHLAHLARPLAILQLLPKPNRPRPNQPRSVRESVHVSPALPLFGGGEDLQRRAVRGGFPSREADLRPCRAEVGYFRVGDGQHRARDDDDAKRLGPRDPDVQAVGFPGEIELFLRRGRAGLRDDVGIVDDDNVGFVALETFRRVDSDPGAVGLPAAGLGGFGNISLSSLSSTRPGILQRDFNAAALDPVRRGDKDSERIHSLVVVVGLGFPPGSIETTKTENNLGGYLGDFSDERIKGNFRDLARIEAEGDGDQGLRAVGRNGIECLKKRGQRRCRVRRRRRPKAINDRQFMPNLVKSPQKRDPPAAPFLVIDRIKRAVVSQLRKACQRPIHSKIVRQNARHADGTRRTGAGPRPKTSCENVQLDAFAVFVPHETFHD